MSEVRGDPIHTVLVLGGYGFFGARIGAAFGMRVLAWSANLTRERCREVGVAYADKMELLASADDRSRRWCRSSPSSGT